MGIKQKVSQKQTGAAQRLQVWVTRPSKSKSRKRTQLPVRQQSRIPPYVIVPRSTTAYRSFKTTMDTWNSGRDKQALAMKVMACPSHPSWPRVRNGKSPRTFRTKVDTP